MLRCFSRSFVNTGLSKHAILKHAHEMLMSEHTDASNSGCQPPLQSMLVLEEWADRFQQRLELLEATKNRQEAEIRSLFANIEKDGVWHRLMASQSFQSIVSLIPTLPLSHSPRTLLSLSLSFSLTRLCTMSQMIHSLISNIQTQHTLSVSRLFN
jgi:hypothetical protein